MLLRYFLNDFEILLSSSSSFVITFIQGIYNRTPVTNHISMPLSVEAIMWLQYMLHVMFLLMIKRFVL